MTEHTYWYRFEDSLISTGEYSPPKIEIVCYKLLVIRLTPKGVKLIGLQYGRSNPRFVAYSSYKKFACATIEEALESFKKRKARQLKILKARTEIAQQAYDKANKDKYRIAENWLDLGQV